MNSVTNKVMIAGVFGVALVLLTVSFFSSDDSSSDLSPKSSISSSGTTLTKDQTNSPNTLPTQDPKPKLFPHLDFSKEASAERQWYAYSKVLRKNKPEISPIGLPNGVNIDREKLSLDEQFKVSVKPSISYLPLNKIHHWMVTVTTPDGKAINPQLQVIGGMPLHGHGFSTELSITPSKEPGVYRLDGVKFNMIGWWQLVFILHGTDNGGTKTTKDSAVFNIPINY